MNKKFLLPLLLPLLLTGCQKAQKKELVVGALTTIEKATRDEYNYDVLTASVTQLPMIGQNAEDGTFYSQLCDYEVASTKQVKFTVRENMKWSDGEYVTANDIKHTFDYMDKRGSNYFVDVETEKGTTAKLFESASISENQRSITINLVNDNVRILSSLLDLRIQPEHIYKNYMEQDSGEPSAELSRVGCGPFTFSSFDKASNTLTFEKSKTYPFKKGEQTPISKLSYVLYANEDAMMMDLIKGQIDYTWIYSSGISADSQKVAAKDGQNVQFHHINKRGVSASIVFNCDKAPFNDKSFRVAVAHAIDYVSARDTFASPYASVPNRSFVPSSTVGYKETEQLHKDETYLSSFASQNGYTDKNAQGFYVKGDEVLQFDLTVDSTKTAHVRYADFVKTSLEKAGIKVNLDPQTTADFRTKTTNKFSHDAGLEGPTHQACILGFTEAGMNMMQGMGSIYINKNHAVQGVAQVNDATFLNAINAMGSASSLEAYETACHSLQDYYAENIPVAALFWDANVTPYNSRLSNMKSDANWGLNSFINWFNISIK